jgi:hypothetical protein
MGSGFSGGIGYGGGGGGDCGEGYCDDPVQRQPPVGFECHANLPNDINQLAIIYTIMHEHTPFGRVGGHQYNPGDDVHHPTGPEITEGTLRTEASFFAAAITSRARTRNTSVYQAVLDYVYDDQYDAQWYLDYGFGIAEGILAGTQDGELECEYLKYVIAAARAAVDSPGIGPYQWWRGHAFRPGPRRPAGHYVTVGDTDFTDYDPSQRH